VWRIHSRNGIMGDWLPLEKVLGSWSVFHRLRPQPDS
jgi:hypothetical protein